MADISLPTRAELQRKAVIAEAYRFSPTRSELDSMAIINDNHHTSTESALHLPTICSECSAAAIVDLPGKIAVTMFEVMRADSVKDHHKLYFGSIYWFDRISDAILPLCIGRSRSVVARKKCLVEVNPESLFNESEVIVRPKNISTREENEFQARGGKPFIRHPPKSSLNDKDPAFGIVWRIRRQEEVDLNHNALGHCLLKERRPLVCNTPINQELSPNEEHLNDSIKEGHANSRYLLEGSSSFNPPNPPSRNEVTSLLKLDVLQISRVELEVEHRRRVMKSLSVDARPPIQIGFFNRHKNPGGLDEQILSEQFRKLGIASSRRKEEPLAPGAIECPMSPQQRRRYKLELPSIPRWVPRHPLSSSPDNPQKAHEMMLAREKEQKIWEQKHGRILAREAYRKLRLKRIQDQIHAAQMFNAAQDAVELSQIADPCRNSAQQQNFPGSSPPQLLLHQAPIAGAERAPDYFYAGSKPRAVTEHHEFLPCQTTREPLPVVKYIRNRQRSKKLSSNVCESYSGPNSLIIEKVHFPQSSSAREDDLPPQNRLVSQSESKNATPGSSSQLQSPLEDSGLPQSLLVSPSTVANPCSVSRGVENSSSPQSSPITQTNRGLLESSSVTCSLQVSRSVETNATSRSQSPRLTFLQSRQLVKLPCFHTHQSELSFGLKSIRRVSNAAQPLMCQPIREERRFTWAEKEKWKATDERLWLSSVLPKV